jgi:hypothetical protein
MSLASSSTGDPERRGSRFPDVLGGCVEDVNAVQT